MITRTGIDDKGWLITHYDGPNLAQVFMAVSQNPPRDQDWRHAFIDVRPRGTVAQIRPYGSGYVWLMVNDQVSQVGTLR